jgi:hypothetical protein
MRAGPGLATAGLLAAACACLPPVQETAAACPPVRSAEAWVNLMPATSAAAEARLIVMLRLEGNERWNLQGLGGNDPSPTLRLELSKGGEGVPGVASWRRPGRETPQAIEIFCAGKLHHRITEITFAR